MIRLAPFALAGSLFAACGSTQVADDLDSIVRVDSEPAGEHCSAGGVAIHTGFDDDRDGYLDDAEIDSTQYACNAISDVQCDGGMQLAETVIVSEPADFDRLANINCIDGDLLIVGTELEALPDIAVKVVTGNVALIGNANLASTHGLALREIGGTLVIQGNAALADLDGVGGITAAFGISILGNDNLVHLHGLEGFTNLDTSVSIANNASLVDLDGLNNLTTTKRPFTIRSNPMLVNLDALGSWRSASSLEFSGNGALESITLPQLAKVDFRSLYNSNVALRSISLPALTATGDFIQLDNNAALVSISAPSLLTLGGILATNDLALTSISMPELVYITRMQIAKVGLRDFTGLNKVFSLAGDLTITGNTQLVGYAGFDALSEIGGNVEINTNPKIPVATSNEFVAGLTVHGTTHVAQ